MEANIFENNRAQENGSLVFVSNLNSSGQILFINNSFCNNVIQFAKNKNNNSLGSIIFLENPSNFIIQSSTFFNNSGIVGACIYYAESIKNYLLIIQKNNFISNKASIAAGAIYFAQIDKNLNINNVEKNNFFLNNKAALYSENCSSPAFRMQINNNKNTKVTKIIPGITSLNFSLSVLDFFDQKILNLNFGSYCIIRLKNGVKFSDTDATISLDGAATVNFING